MKSRLITPVIFLFGFFLFHKSLQAQNQPASDSTGKNYKNIIRYNISGALIFGFDKYVIIGYERILSPRRSFSINVGAAAFPKLVNINTDSFSVSQDVKNKGFNFSVDYRFYLSKVNKYDAPRGVYIGPYYSFNRFERNNDWDYTGPGSVNKLASTSTTFNIHTVGAELGYQFVFWKRLALDLVLIGPGLGFYDMKAKLDGNLTEDDKTQLRDALQQIITQKFPGMNFVFSEKEINANGVLRTTSIGYRYLIHIGFRF